MNTTKRKDNNTNKKKEEWERLVEFISEKFGGGERLDLQAILFLIGVNELGQGYRDFTKDEKTNLLHIAICKLLSHYDYYTFVGRDDDGWPHWKTNNESRVLDPEKQITLMKESAVLYFKNAKILF